MASSKPDPIPPVTIVIEWENAIDVYDNWTRSTIAALARELAAYGPRMTAKPKVMYLFDRNAVRVETIEEVLDAAAPTLRQVADLELVPTDGLTYYKLKNFGIERATTEFAIVLDSDAAPQPGWLESILAPFADPSIMVVAGFTALAHDSVTSRAMALSWFFDLPEEREKTEKRLDVHANNFAVRTDFFRANPFPELPLFKKHSGFWLREVLAAGHGFKRTADAMTIHAPHPGLRYLLWRGWQSGSDRDYQIYSLNSPNRLVRVAQGLFFTVKKTGRSWFRILAKGAAVDLPWWQRPAAMGVAFLYYSSAGAAEIKSAVTRSFEGFPPARDGRRRPSVSPRKSSPQPRRNRA